MYKSVYLNYEYYFFLITQRKKEISRAQIFICKKRIGNIKGLNEYSLCIQNFKDIQKKKLKNNLSICFLKCMTVSRYILLMYTYTIYWFTKNYKTFLPMRLSYFIEKTSVCGFLQKNKKKLQLFLYYTYLFIYIL